MAAIQLESEWINESMSESVNHWNQTTRQQESESVAERASQWTNDSANEVNHCQTTQQQITRKAMLVALQKFA